MKLIYDVETKPREMGIGNMIVFAIQQLLAIMAATLVVPVIVGHGMSPAAALFGAGVGTLTYIFFTRRKSPVFLGSSFAFLGSMAAAFAGGVSMSLGYLGLILGAFFAGIVYVIIAMIVKFCGVAWISKLMPPVVIGPTVTIIGLSLAGNAIGDLQKGGYNQYVYEWVMGANGPTIGIGSYPTAAPLVCVLIGLITLAVTTLCSVYAKKKMIRLIPFIMGILSGYAVACLFTVVGILTETDALRVIDFGHFQNLLVEGKVALTTFVDLPDFTFLTAFKGDYDPGQYGSIAQYILTILVAYCPVAFVVFAEHIADHKNLSTIIGRDLLEEPGLSNTLLGDGVGSMVGAFFGGCPNTTYGESVGCVAITGNASVWSIMTAAIGAILISFFSPFAAFVNSIPPCVMGGVCMALYGFIAVSGLKMLKNVDLEKNYNLFTVSVILIAGVGGLTLSFGKVTITAIACALILGILTHLLLTQPGNNDDTEAEAECACDGACEACADEAETPAEAEAPVCEE